MSDPFLEREKELMKLNESLNTKMTFGLKQPKAAAASTTATGNRMKKTIAKPFKCDQINHAKLCSTKATSKLKADNCEIIKKPISNAYTDTTVVAAVQKFTAVEKNRELDAKDIGFNRNISSHTNGSSNSSHRNGDDTHTTCNGGIKQTTTTTTVMGDGGGDDDDDNKQQQHQISNEHFDHALIESIEKAIGTKDVVPSATTTTAAHLSLIPPNVYRKNISNDGIIK